VTVDRIFRGGVLSLQDLRSGSIRPEDYQGPVPEHLRGCEASSVMASLEQEPVVSRGYYFPTKEARAGRKGAR
jgi:hypothetical protein